MIRAFFYSSLGYSAAVLCKFSSLPLACAIVCRKFCGDRQRKRLSRHKGRSEPNLPSQVRGAQCLSAAWTFNSLWNYFAEIWHKSNTFFAMLRLSLQSGNMTVRHNILQCPTTLYLCFWAISGDRKYSVCYMTWGERYIASKGIKVKPCSYWDGHKIATHS